MYSCYTVVISLLFATLIVRKYIARTEQVASGENRFLVQVALPLEVLSLVYLWWVFATVEDEIYSSLIRYIVLKILARKSERITLLLTALASTAFILPGSVPASKILIFTT